MTSSDYSCIAIVIAVLTASGACMWRNRKPKQRVLTKFDKPLPKEY